MCLEVLGSHGRLYACEIIRLNGAFEATASCPIIRLNSNVTTRFARICPNIVLRTPSYCLSPLKNKRKTYRKHGFRSVPVLILLFQLPFASLKIAYSGLMTLRVCANKALGTMFSTRRPSLPNLSAQQKQNDLPKRSSVSMGAMQVVLPAPE